MDFCDFAFLVRTACVPSIITSVSKCTICTSILVYDVIYISVYFASVYSGICYMCNSNAVDVYLFQWVERI